MNNTIIKVINPKKASQLTSLGFRCVEEKCGDKILYTFFNSKELIEYLNSNFEKTDYLLTNKLTF